MRIGSFAAVSLLVCQRRNLQRQLRETINIVIGGEFQDAGLLNAIRPAIEVQLHLRIEQIERELLELGVSIDE